MIDLFIIHSGTDAEYILEEVIPGLINNKEDGETAHANILMLGAQEREQSYDTLRNSLDNPDNFRVKLTGERWKKDARDFIKRARAVLVIVGEDTAEKEDSIGYEVKLAQKYNKLVLIHKTKENIRIPQFLMTKDPFTGKMKPLAKIQQIGEIRERIDHYDMGYYNIFSDDKYRDGEIDEQSAGRIMEQYIMYQKTSEDLINRRQSVSSFYISVNSALVALAGFLMGLLSFPDSILIVLLLSVVGIILDVSWIKILDAYGALNAAKMKVITMVEKQLPISLYDVEWQVMSDKLNQKKYVSFTDSEKRIPKLFICVYFAFLVLAIVFLSSSVWG